MVGLSIFSCSYSQTASEKAYFPKISDLYFLNLVNVPTPYQQLMQKDKLTVAEKTRRELNSSVQNKTG